MTERTRQLLDAVLKLPPDEISEFLVRLESELEAAEPALDPELMNEVHRRVDRVLAGDRRGSTVHDVAARIRATVAERRAGK